MISIQDLLLRKFAWQSSGWLETTLNQMLWVRAQLLDQQLSTCWQFQQFVWWPFQLVKEEGNLLCFFGLFTYFVLLSAVWGETEWK